MPVAEDMMACPSFSCTGPGQELELFSGLDLVLDISDHTGTLQSCGLSGTVAEKTLGCTVSLSNLTIYLKIRCLKGVVSSLL